MKTDEAAKLALDLRREKRAALGVTRLRADVVGDRLVFSGGRHPHHGLAIDVSTPARVLAHWEGYCADNGMPRPVLEQRVSFIGGTGKRYEGVVEHVGRVRVRVAFHYRHGGAAKAHVRISELRYL